MKGVNFVLDKKHIEILDRLYVKKGFKNRSQLIRDLIELEDRIDKREQTIQENTQQQEKTVNNTLNSHNSSFKTTKTTPNSKELMEEDSP